MTNKVNEAIIKMYEARMALNEALKEANKELELAEIDMEHANWYMNRLENEYSIEKDEAIGLKLEKAYTDNDDAIEAYEIAKQSVDIINEAIEKLNSIETDIYYFA